MMARFRRRRDGRKSEGGDCDVGGGRAPTACPMHPAPARICDDPDATAPHSGMGKSRSNLCDYSEPGAMAGVGGSGLLGTVVCDDDFVIRRCDDGALSVLGYDGHEDLVGRSVTELMSPLVARIHDRIFQGLKSASDKEFKCIAEKLVYGMSNCRDFALIDARREPVVCGISIFLREDGTSTMLLLRLDTKLLHTVPRGFEQYINRPPGLHVQDYRDVMCVMMDVAGSTEYARRVGSSNRMAELMHEAYAAVNHAILREVFPFAYIHEICGDSLLLIVNAGFMVRHSEEAALIAMHTATTAQSHIDKKLAQYDTCMHARCGVSMGDVTAGVVDGRSFRVFGEAVHLSQRLESVCPQGGIACSNNFLQLLASQGVDLAGEDGLEDAMGLKSATADLKGFGMTEYGVLNTKRCYGLLRRSGRRQSSVFSTKDPSVASRLRKETSM